jgi:hypothetical protein
MTIEEKAKELVEKFEIALGPNTGIVAAEICCDEVLNAFERYDNDINRYEPCRPLESYDYWKQVKNNIQSL